MIYSVILAVCALFAAVQGLADSFPPYYVSVLNQVVAAHPSTCAAGQKHVVVSYFGDFAPFAGDDQFTGAAWSLSGVAGEDFSGPSNGFRSYDYCVPASSRTLYLRAIGLSSNASPDNLCYASSACGFAVLVDNQLAYLNNWFHHYKPEAIARTQLVHLS
jgi:hypothetical protein